MEGNLECPLPLKVALKYSNLLWKIYALAYIQRFDDNDKVFSSLRRSCCVEGKSIYMVLDATADDGGNLGD